MSRSTWKQWLGVLAGRSRSKQGRTQERNRFRPNLEVLEDRLAPAVYEWVGDSSGVFQEANNWKYFSDADHLWHYGGIPGADDYAYADGVNLTANGSGAVEALFCNSLNVTGGAFSVSGIGIDYTSGHSALNGNVMVTGGSFIVGADYDLSRGMVIRGNVSVAENATFQVVSNAVVEIDGSLAYDGVVKCDGALVEFGDTTVGSTGWLQVSGAAYFGDGFVNNGLVDLYGGRLFVSEAFINPSWGSIRTHAGNIQLASPVYIGGSLDNQGFIDVNTDTELYQGNMRNSGFLFVETGNTLTLAPGDGNSLVQQGNMHLEDDAHIALNGILDIENGLVVGKGASIIGFSGSVVNYNGGSILGEGVLHLKDLTFNFDCTGQPTFPLSFVLHNSNVYIAPDTSPADFVMQAYCTLTGTIGLFQSVEVRGSSDDGEAFLSLDGTVGAGGAVEPFINNGTITLDSVGGAYDAFLHTGDGLLNDYGAILAFEPGDGGGRFLQGSLVNKGKIEVDTNATFRICNMLNDVSGVIDVANYQTLTLSQATLQNNNLLDAIGAEVDFIDSTLYNLGGMNVGIAVGTRSVFNQSGDGVLHVNDSFSEDSLSSFVYWGGVLSGHVPVLNGSTLDIETTLPAKFVMAGGTLKGNIASGQSIIGSGFILDGDVHNAGILTFDTRSGISSLADNTLTNDPTGVINFNESAAISVNLINRGTVNVNSNGALQPASDQTTPLQLVNYNAFNIASDASFAVMSGGTDGTVPSVFIQDGGTISVADLSSLSLQNGGELDLNGGTIEVNGGFSLFPGSVLKVNDGLLDVPGGMSIDSATLTMTGGTLAVANWFDAINTSVVDLIGGMLSVALDTANMRFFDASLLTLTGASLAVTLDHVPDPGTVFTVLRSQAGINGIFAGLPDGTEVNLHGSHARVSYPVWPEDTEVLLTVQGDMRGIIAEITILSPQVLSPGQSSLPLTVQLKDDTGNPVTAPVGGLNVQLSSSSSAGQFLDTEGQPISALYLPEGDSSATFAYVDSQRGFPTIYASTGEGSDLVGQVMDVGYWLAFTTDSQMLTAGQPSPPITVQLQDSNGQPLVAPAGGVYVQLSSSSQGGQFLDTEGQPISALYIPEGDSSAQFAYQDALGGTPTLTASVSGTPLSATQQETVQESLFYPKIVAPYQALTPGQPSPPFTIELVDSSGNPIAADSDVTVQLSSTSSGGQFLDTSGQPLADSSFVIPAGSNSAQFEYEDSQAGFPTLSATAIGAANFFSSTVVDVGVSLQFTTTAQSLAAGQPSLPITLQLQDGQGQAVAAPSGGVYVSLSSSSQGGQFLDTSGIPLSYPLISIAEGSSSASFKYESAWGERWL